MDLSPEVINEVEFAMARRGYNPDQVDEFLEKVAVAIAELTERLAEARERALVAERRANELGRKAAERDVDAPSAAAAESVSAQAEAELETLKRTLVLAQRTADAAMKEAEQEAATLRANALAEAAKLVSDAESDARAAHEDTLRALVAEIATLESARDGLRDDVRALERHVDEQRLRLRGSITELQRILDDPARLQAATPPIPLAVPATEPPVAGTDEEAPAPPVPELEEPPASVRAAVAEPEAADRSGEEFEGLGLTLDDADDDAWARFSAPDELETGPPTEPVIRLDDSAARGADDDDAYLSELRKAMLEDTGAPDIDDSVLFDDGEERSGRSRFGRRR